jgi:hypothetical protein
MHIETTNTTKAGVAYATTEAGFAFSYNLFNDTWLSAVQTPRQLGIFMRRHQLRDLEEIDFTHVLKMEGRTIESE